MEFLSFAQVVVMIAQVDHALHALVDIPLRGHRVFASLALQIA